MYVTHMRCFPMHKMAQYFLKTSIKLERFPYLRLIACYIYDTMLFGIKLGSMNLVLTISNYSFQYNLTNPVILILASRLGNIGSQNRIGYKVIRPSC